MKLGWDDASTPQSETWLGQCYRARHDRLYVGVPLLGALFVRHPVSKPPFMDLRKRMLWMPLVSESVVLAATALSSKRQGRGDVRDGGLKDGGVDDGRDTSPGASQRRG